MKIESFKARRRRINQISRQNMRDFTKECNAQVRMSTFYGEGDVNYGNIVS